MLLAAAVLLAGAGVTAALLVGGDEDSSTADNGGGAEDAGGSQGGGGNNGGGGDKGSGASGPSGGQVSPSIDPAVDKLLEQIESGSTAGRAQAAEELAELGAAASPATERLCELVTSRDEDTRDAALAALERVGPALFPHVRTLLTIEDDYRRAEALERLKALGRSGRPALPVVLWHHEQGRQTAETLTTLATIAPEDSRVEELLREHLHPVATEEYERHRIANSAIAGLGEMAVSQPGYRDGIVQAVAPLLKDEALQLAAVQALAKCGGAAQPTLAELKTLRFRAGSQEVQQAVDAALAEIESFVAAKQKIEALGQNPDPKRLARLAVVRDDFRLRQLAREALRNIDPRLEEIALLLFEPPPDEVPDASTDWEARLAAVESIVNFGRYSTAATPMVIEYIARLPRRGHIPYGATSENRYEVHHAAYRALARLAPDDADVRAAYLQSCTEVVEAACQRHDEPYARALWLAEELLARQPEDEALARLVLDCAEKLGQADSANDVPGPLYLPLVARIIAHLNALAQSRPDLRKEIAATLVTLPPSDDPRPMIETLIRCGQDAQPAIEAIRKESRVVAARVRAVLGPRDPFSPEETAFEPLFNGKDLTGWVGPGDWRVEGGVIIGERQSARGPTQFLRHEGLWRDFELRLEVKAQARNSGLQFRSARAQERSPRYSEMLGPQVELSLDTYAPFSSQTERKNYIGGDRETWADAEVVKSAFKPDEFNEVILRCVGPRVTVAVNGVVTLDEDLDWLTREGLLAFETPHDETDRIELRNIRIRVFAQATGDPSAVQTVPPRK